MLLKLIIEINNVKNTPIIVSQMALDVLRYNNAKWLNNKFHVKEITIVHLLINV